MTGKDIKIMKNVGEPIFKQCKKHHANINAFVNKSNDNTQKIRNISLYHTITHFLRGVLPKLLTQDYLLHGSFPSNKV